MLSDRSVDPRVLCGIVAGLISCIAFLPYILDTLRGRTQPERATWFIWAVMSSISFFSQVYEGATSSLLFVFVQAAATVLIFIVSIRNGSGAYFSRQSIGLFACCAVGLGVWYMAETAIYTLVMAVTISAMGASVTVVKAYRDPQSETETTWVLSLIAVLLAIVSVGQLDVVLLIYPLYLYALYSTILLAMHLGRLHQQGASGAVSRVS